MCQEGHLVCEEEIFGGEEGKVKKCYFSFESMVRPIGQSGLNESHFEGKGSEAMLRRWEEFDEAGLRRLNADGHFSYNFVVFFGCKRAIVIFCYRRLEDKGQVGVKHFSDGLDLLYEEWTRQNGGQKRLVSSVNVYGEEDRGCPQENVPEREGRGIA